MDRDRNLLFGVLAVQLNKLSANQLVEAAELWAGEPTRPLHDHIQALGFLTARECTMLVGLVDAAVREHQGDASATLETFGGKSQVHKTFQGTLTLTESGGVLSAHKASADSESSYPGEETLNTVEEVPGRYTHVSEYARGGMGRVLLIHDQHLGREIALKELLPSASPEGTTLKPGTPVRQAMAVVHRFLQEARITGQLDHPSVVPVYEVGRRRDGRLYYTMKLVRGQTLSKVIRDTTSLSDRLRLLPHFLDLCQAIAYAHERRVIHRDLKPENVMVGDFGETVVIDWGLAKVLDGADAHAEGLEETLRAMRMDTQYKASYTVYGDALGTPVYMSPEQAQGKLDQVDERSDVYSLGAVLYEMLSGEAPYSGPSAHQIMNQVVSAPPAPLREAAPTVPGELLAICERAMDRDRMKRYPSARQLAAEIERFQAGALVQAYSYRFSEHLRRFISQHRPILTTAAAGLLAVILLAGLSYVRVVREKGVAIEARNAAVLAQKEEEKERNTAERQLYFSSILLARQSIDAQQFDVAQTALEHAPAALRNWEWSYYDRLCRLDQHTLSGFTGIALRVTFSPDGTQVATVDEGTAVKVWDVSTGTEAFSLQGHRDGITSVHFSPDGTRLLTSSADATAAVWDARTGRQLTVLSGHDAVVRNAAFSPDGARVATASQDRTAKVWETATGKLLLTLAGHTDVVKNAVFSPDGRRILTASLDRTARVWDATDGIPLSTLAGHTSGVFDAAFSPDGRHILTSSVDHTLKLWDADAGQEQATLTNHDSSVYRALFSPSGDRVISAWKDGTVRVWDLAAGQEQLVLDGHTGSVLSVAVSRDGERIATASVDKAIKIWDAATGRELLTLPGHSKTVQWVCFSPDGKEVASASADGTVKLWDSHKLLERARSTLADNASQQCWSAVFSPDGARVLTASADREAKLWDVASGTEVAALVRHSSSVSSAKFSADGKRIATASSDGTAKIWDAVTDKEIVTLTGHQGPVMTAEFSPDATRVVTASLDHTAKIWDAATGSLLFTLTGHQDELTGAAFSPDGKLIVTSSWDKLAILWDAQTGQERTRLVGHRSGVGGASFSPDGAQLVTFTREGTAQIWEVASGKEQATLTGHLSQVTSAVFSADGAHVLTASTDATARVWDATTGVPQTVLRGHDDCIFSAVFSPDGSRILTASADGTARVWDAEEGLELAVLKGHTRQVVRATFSPNGTLIATASSDASSKVWGGL